MAKVFKQHYALQIYQFDNVVYYPGNPIPQDVVDRYGPTRTEVREVGEQDVLPLKYTKHAPPLPEPVSDDEAEQGEEEVLVWASSQAEELAKEHGLTPGDITGTGTKGSIKKADVEAAIAAREG